MRIGAAVDPSKQMSAEPREELCREGERPGIAAVRQVLEDLGEDVAGLEGAGRTDPAMIRALLRFQADTAIAPSGRTDRATRRALCAAAPPEGRRLERFPEYERLLADGRLEMTIAHGFYDEDAAEMARSIARLRAGLAALGFRDGPDGTLLRSV